jgi:CDP-paratose 2-epimerase
MSTNASSTRWVAPHRRWASQGPVVITGGAGFVGTNLAQRLLQSGRRVILLDNLSRPGVERNACWLGEAHGSRVQLELADVRRPNALTAALREASSVFHFAAQVAVTTSLADPRADFETNAVGTLNVLEAIRGLPAPPPLVFTSTNKVYGACDDVPLAASAQRYEPRDRHQRAQGIDEQRPLDFHSPYGCSKGAADQYVRDYARSFGLPAVVFRMSCIYGPHQFGTEDQGWVAHFVIRALEGRPVTVYGDGKQVRDVLFVEDLVDALLLAEGHAGSLAGRAFNVGGGAANTISLLELLELLRELHGALPEVSFADWRTGDQKHYVSETRALQAATGWCPRVGVREGVTRLYEWLKQSRRRSVPRAGLPGSPSARRPHPAPLRRWPEASPARGSRVSTGGRA